MTDRPYIMFGFEWSCEVYAAAIVGSDKTIYANEIASQIGCLVITETRRPHKVFEILASTEGKKDILAPAFMKINKSIFQLGKV